MVSQTIQVVTECIYANFSIAELRQRQRAADYKIAIQTYRPSASFSMAIYLAF